MVFIHKLKHLSQKLPYLFVGLSSLFLSSCALNDRMSTFDYKGPVAKVQYDFSW